MHSRQLSNGRSVAFSFFKNELSLCVRLLKFLKLAELKAVLVSPNLTSFKNVPSRQLRSSLIFCWDNSSSLRHRFVKHKTTGRRHDGIRGVFYIAASF